jgi:hypothetical protein
MSVPRNPYFGTYIHDCDAGEGMAPRWPHKDAVTEFPLTALGFAFVCRFNGVKIENAPKSWMYAPNAYMMRKMNRYGLCSIEEQDAYIAWSRKPGQANRPPMNPMVIVV